jgi:hypothetical protein
MVCFALFGAGLLVVGSTAATMSAPLGVSHQACTADVSRSAPESRGRRKSGNVFSPYGQPLRRLRRRCLKPAFGRQGMRDRRDWILRIGEIRRRRDRQMPQRTLAGSQPPLSRAIGPDCGPLQIGSAAPSLPMAFSSLPRTGGAEATRDRPKLSHDRHFRPCRVPGAHSQPRQRPLLGSADAMTRPFKARRPAVSPRPISARHTMDQARSIPAPFPGEGHRAHRGKSRGDAGPGSL